MRYGWSIDPQPWRRLTAACRDRTWKRTYLEDSYKNGVPMDPGIYLICASTNYFAVLPPLYTAVYVGQAVNLRRRFRDHARGRTQVRLIQTIFRRLEYWYVSLPRNQLDELEQAWIDAVGPTINERNVRARVEPSVPAGSVRKPQKKEY